MTGGLAQHQHVSREIRRRIAQGAWAEGMQLPSEAALCREFGTSRGPVRTALAALRAEGLVVGGRGKAPTVARFVPAQEFSTFRSFTQWAESLGKTPGSRTIELARRPASTVVAGLLGLGEGETVVEVLRVRSLDDVPAMTERSSFIAEVGRHLFDFDPDSGSIHAFLARRGVDLHRARHTIDAVGANRLDAELLAVPVGTPLLRERRITRDAGGHPLEVAEERYRPEQVTFTLENPVEQLVPFGERVSAGA